MKLKQQFILLKIWLNIRLRDKISLFWNIAFPILIFTQTMSNRNQESNPIYFLFTFISWIVFQSSLHGVGLYLLSYRESGFMKAHFHSTASRYILITNLILTQMLMILMSTIILILVYQFLFKFPVDVDFFLLIPATLAISLIFCLASVFLSVLPLNAQTTSTVVSMIVFPFIYFANKTDGVWFYVNKLNPITFSNALLEFTYFKEVSRSYWELVVYVVVLAIIGVVGIVINKTESLVSR